MEHKAKYTWTVTIRSLNSESFESDIFTASTNGYKWSLEAKYIECDQYVETYRLYLHLNSTGEPLPTSGKCEFYVNPSPQSATRFVTFEEIKFKPTVDNWGDVGDPEPSLFLKDFSKHRRKDETFKIYCEVSFSVCNPDINRSVSSDSKFRLFSDFKRLLKTTEFADIVISVKDKEFKAHKIILIARSPVFAAMFRHKNTEESQQDKIVINDLDEQVVEEMLNYIYTGISENLEEQADGLLAAAEKYGLVELKDMSEKAIIGNLSVRNAVDALQLAYLYCASELKSCAIDLIVAKSSEVMKTPAWKTMASSCPHLSVEVCEAFSRLVASKQESK